MITVTRDDVERELERTLSSDEFALLGRRIEAASDLVEGYIGFAYVPYDPFAADDVDRPDDVPDVVVRVVSAAVARVYDADSKNVPEFVEATTQGMGPFNVTQKFNQDATSGTPWLTKSDKMKLRLVFSGMRSSLMRSDRRC